MNARGHAAALRDPGAFRCLVCKRYVHGTEAGHCPSCGFVPPVAPTLPEPRRFSMSRLVAAIAIAGAVIAVAVSV